MLNYGTSYQRIYGDTYQSNVLKKRRVYVNSLYEQEKDYTTGKVKETFYIFGGDGLVAIRVNDATGDNVSYVHKDHLGSIQCLTNDAGVLAQEMSYDAWGNRRDPISWSVYATAPAGLITDRGFTGHEHIDLFDLVNMDGRVYDPVIGRFLSADPVIQDIENLQSLNRYSYCGNNPLSLTDPSGYSWLSDSWRSLLSAAIAITVSIVSLGTATALSAIILAGGAGGFAGGFSGVLLNGGNLGQALVGGVVGGLIGAATSFLSYGAGCLPKLGENAKLLTKIGQMLEKAGRHAFVDVWLGGVKCAIYGGEISPIRDMIGGAISSLGNGAIDDNVKGLVLKMASSAVLGGTISEIGGGKFANGAVTGAYSMLFNELEHPDDDNIRETNLISNTIAKSLTVQKVENSLFNDNGDSNVALQLLDNLGSKVAKQVLKVIDIVKFAIDYIAPITNESLNKEYYYFQNHPVPQTYRIHGTRMDKNGNYINY